ncbi:MAG: hypothetical protein AB1792_01830 [Candidatus Zixiibacteriota bacterium]
MARTKETSAGAWYRDARFIIQNAIAAVAAFAACIAVFKVGNVAVQLERIGKVEIRTRARRHLDDFDRYLAFARQSAADSIDLTRSRYSGHGLGRSSQLALAIGRVADATIDSIRSRYLSVSRALEDAMLEIGQADDSSSAAHVLRGELVRLSELHARADSTATQIQSMVISVLRQHGIPESLYQPR